MPVFLPTGNLTLNFALKGLTMGTIQLILFIAFAVLTTLGYKKNNRNLMLLGTITISFAFVGLEFLLGFDEGLSRANYE